MLETFPAISLLPAFIAVVLVFGTRRVISSLLISVIVAVGLLHGPNPLAVVLNTQQRLVAEIADPSNASVLLLLVLIGGFVSLLQATGAPEAFIQRFIGVLHTPRSARMMTVLSGSFLFFSDSASPLLRGPMFAPLFDKLRLSREKLAFLLDATAAPVSSIVPISPWTTVVIALVAKEFSELQVDDSPVEVALAAIPYQFYTITLLLLALVTAWFDLSFGAMRKADEAAAGRAVPLPQSGTASSHAVESGPSSWWTLVIALGLLVGTLAVVMLAPTLGILASDGNQSLLINTMPGITLGFSVASLYLLVTLIVRHRVSVSRIQRLWLRGVLRVFEISAILLLAWSLGSCMKELGTGSYLAEICRDRVPLALTPLMIFLVSSLASFANGTAWGCYALFIPISMSIGVELGLELPLVLGAVVSGSLMGDQCSPFSDTTILSSAGAGCNHVQHVWTQLPYALLAMTISAIAFAATASTSLWMGYGVIAVLLAIFAAFIQSRNPQEVLQHVPVREAAEPVPIRTCG